MADISFSASDLSAGTRRTELPDSKGYLNYSVEPLGRGQLHIDPAKQNIVPTLGFARSVMVGKSPTRFLWTGRDSSLSGTRQVFRRFATASG